MRHVAMQHIVVEIFGEKKTVTIAQLRDMIKRNYISLDSKLFIDGVAYRVNDVYDHIVNGTPISQSNFEPKPFESSVPNKSEQNQASQRTNSPLFEPLTNKRENEMTPSPSFPSPTFASKKTVSSRRRSKNLSFIMFSTGIAIVVLIGAITFLSTKEAPNQQEHSSNRKQIVTSEKNESERMSEKQKKANDNSNDSTNLSPNTTQYTDFKKEKGNFSKLYKEKPKLATSLGPKQTHEVNEDDEEYEGENANSLQHLPDFFKTSANIDIETEDDTSTELQINPGITKVSPIQVTEVPKSTDPLLVVDHDKIFAEFFSDDARKDKIPSTVTINSSQKLEQVLTQLENKSQTIILEPNTAPYELKRSMKIEGEITIKGKTGNPLDAWILVIPESTLRSGAFEVSRGKLALDGVTVWRKAPCSDEYALISVTSRGKASINNCVFDATEAKGARGVSAVGIGSSVNLEEVTFKGFADGIYTYSSARMSIYNSVFEENEHGATVGNGGELKVTESSFIRNKIGVQVKVDGLGSLTKSSFEENDIPCDVAPYSEKKFMRTNNIGLD